MIQGVLCSSSFCNQTKKKRMEFESVENQRKTITYYEIVWTRIWTKNLAIRTVPLRLKACWIRINLEHCVKVIYIYKGMLDTAPNESISLIFPVLIIELEQNMLYPVKIYFLLSEVLIQRNLCIWIHFCIAQYSMVFSRVFLALFIRKYYLFFIDLVIIMITHVVHNDPTWWKCFSSFSLLLTKKRWK